MTEVVEFAVERASDDLVARQRIRRGMTNEDFLELPMSEQIDICDQHFSELRDLEWRGTCSGNCTSDCYTTDRAGLVICRWTWAPCPMLQIKTIYDLFSIVNQES
jgi:hypothetical protein